MKMKNDDNSLVGWEASGAMAGMVPKEYRDDLARLQLTVAAVVVAIVSTIWVASAFGFIGNDANNPVASAVVAQNNTLFVAVAGGSTWFIYDALRKLQEQKLKSGGSQGTTGPPPAG